MPLSRLQVESVRCLRGVRVELAPERNVVIGPNGAGKTSLLESVFLLARGRSFRTRETRRLVQNGSAGFSVFGEAGVRGGAGSRVGVGFSEGSLKIRINDAPARGMAELADVLVAHVIDPSSHELIEGGPSVRRRFVDAGVFHVEHSYLEVWRNYRRVLGQRNAALKQGERGASLKVWSQPLLEAAEAIHRARSAYVERVGVQTQAIGKRLLSRELALVYRPGWRVGLDYPSALAESERRDRETGFTQVGPHRADVAVRMDGKLVREQASRGQQKLVAAACVLAEAAELAGSGRLGSATQMLLVDDPGAELDSGSLERLFAELDGVPIQQLVTAIGGETLPDTRSAVFHVEQGRVKAVV